MAAIAFIRHGQYHQLPDTPSARQPYPLTQAGEEEVKAQAKRFAAWLSETGYRLEPAIHSSTSLRAWQTAEIYREQLQPFFAGEAHVHSFSALCERSVGSLANLTVSEIERVVALDPRLAPLPEGWKSSSNFRLPFDGAESHLEAGARVARHLQTLPVFEGSGRIQLIVGHGASIRHASYHLNVIPFSDIERLSMFYGHPVVFEKQNTGWVPLFGHWKRRQAPDPID